MVEQGRIIMEMKKMSWKTVPINRGPSTYRNRSLSPFDISFDEKGVKGTQRKSWEWRENRF